METQAKEETQATNRLTEILFEFRKPGKLDLEEFMNRHFTFKVSIERFAFLTGRSLSAFKRDFNTIFNHIPTRWLVQKHLQEAYLLIEKKNKKPSVIYLNYYRLARQASN